VDGKGIWKRSAAAEVNSSRAVKTSFGNSCTVRCAARIFYRLWPETIPAMWSKLFATFGLSDGVVRLLAHWEIWGLGLACRLSAVLGNWLSVRHRPYDIGRARQARDDHLQGNVPVF
jgi:hypothetical protein